MASLLASMAARRVTNLTRLASPSPSASLLQRRGLASAADHHGPTKVSCWQDPMNPGNWKEEHFVIASLSGWGLLFTGAYKLFSGGKKDTQGIVVEASQ